MRTNAVFLHLVKHRPPKKTPKFRAVVSVSFRNEIASRCAAADVACFQPVNASRMDANFLTQSKQQPKAFMPKDDYRKPPWRDQIGPICAAAGRRNLMRYSNARVGTFASGQYRQLSQYRGSGDFPDPGDCRVGADLGCAIAQKRPDARPFRTRRSALQPCEIMYAAFGATVFVRPSNF